MESEQLFEDVLDLGLGLGLGQRRGLFEWGLVTGGAGYECWRGVDFLEFQLGNVVVKGFEHSCKEVLDKDGLAVDNKLVVINILLVPFGRDLEQKII